MSDIILNWPQSPRELSLGIVKNMWSGMPLGIVKTLVLLILKASEQSPRLMEAVSHDSGLMLDALWTSHSLLRVGDRDLLSPGQLHRVVKACYAMPFEDIRPRHWEGASLEERGWTLVRHVFRDHPEALRHWEARRHNPLQTHTNAPGGAETPF